MYDLAGDSKKSIAADVEEFIKENPSIISLIRSIKENNVSSEEINIKTNANSLPTELIQKIFNADLNNVVIFSDKENVYFSKIIEIKIPSESTFLEDINLVSDLKNGFGSEVIKKKNISINDELIIGILSQYK